MRGNAEVMATLIQQPPALPAVSDQFRPADEGSVMSLSTWEQQVLNSITDRLAGSDPELAALLIAFTWFASGEQMPVSERIRASSRRAIRCSRSKTAAPAPGQQAAALPAWGAAGCTHPALPGLMDSGRPQRCSAGNPPFGGG